MQLSKSLLPFTRIYISKELKAIRLEHLSFFAPIETWMQIWDHAFSEIEKHKLTCWIADTYNCRGALENTALSYIKKSVIQRATNAGIEKVLTILPKELGLPSASNKKWQETVFKSGYFVTKDFLSLASALCWLKESHDSNSKHRTEEEARVITRNFMLKMFR